MKIKNIIVLSFLVLFSFKDVQATQIKDLKSRNIMIVIHGKISSPGINSPTIEITPTMTIKEIKQKFIEEHGDFIRPGKGNKKEDCKLIATKMPLSPKDEILLGNENKTLVDYHLWDKLKPNCRSLLLISKALFLSLEPYAKKIQHKLFKQQQKQKKTNFINVIIKTSH